MIYNNINQKLMKEIRQKIQNHLRELIDNKIDNDDPVATDIEMKTNVMKTTELSTSGSVARNITQTPDENVDT